MVGSHPFKRGFKIKFDEALNQSKKMDSIGFVMHDYNSKVLATKGVQFKHVLDANLLQALALKELVQYASSHCLSKETLSSLLTFINKVKKKIIAS